MKGLKQSTVATVIVGPVLDSTGAAVTNAVVGDFRLAKNGTVATLSGATVTHDANGYYLIALTTGNTDTPGRLVLTSGNTAHSMASHHWSVLPASVFDALYTNATNSTGGLVTATGTITALAGAVSTLTAGGVRTELNTELGRIDANIGSRATQTSVDAIDDYVDTEVAAIKAKTDLIVAFPDNFASMVINANNGHVAVTVHAIQAGAYTSAAFAANWFTAAGLASDAVTEVVNGVWNEPTSGHTTAGTTGKALIDSGAAGNPWSTDLSTGYSGTQAGNILNSVKSQADLIQAGGTVNVTTPVTATGQLASPLIIGDDYLNANGRAFSWTVALPSGFVAATATCKFGMRYEDDQGVNSFIQSGTVIDAGSGNVTLRFDVAKSVTELLRPGWYDWSVEIASASGTEITRVKSGNNAEWQEKQT
jgi:molybdopterin-binding protein